MCLMLQMDGKVVGMLAQHPHCTAPAWHRESENPRHSAHRDGWHFSAPECIGTVPKKGQIERKHGNISDICT